MCVGFASTFDAVSVLSRWKWRKYFLLSRKTHKHTINKQATTSALYPLFRSLRSDNLPFYCLVALFFLLVDSKCSTCIDDLFHTLMPFSLISPFPIRSKRGFRTSRNSENIPSPLDVIVICRIQKKKNKHECLFQRLSSSTWSHFTQN